MSTLTTDSSFMSLTQWRWDWEFLCGAGGLKIWSQETHDIGLCFQQLFLQIPVLSVLACTSAYYFGRNGRPVIRGAVQILAINLRCFMVLIMSLLPLLQIYIDLYRNETKILKISYYLCAVEGITWFVHFCFCLSLRKTFGLSPRGPVSICVIWSSILVLTVISLRSHYLSYKFAVQPDFSIYLSYTFSIINFMLQIMYALSLLPGKGDSMTTGYESLPPPQEDESTPLLRDSYIRLFNPDNDPSYLGVAMENEHWLSKLLFSWVHPLMEKGDDEKLKSSDDLFDLPSSISCSVISSKMEKQLIPKIDHYTNLQRFDDLSRSTSSNTPDVQIKALNVTLFKALHKLFWKEFYGIGILKFVSDCAGFAAPMILNRLVNFIENKNEQVGWGYLYAAGLASSTLISALCDSHFQFRMTIISLKMRAALVTTIYQKILAVNGSVLNSSFSVGEIINFMSTDTDRIVNSCPSFHAVWSIPFQLVITLYLLYTQVGIAFIAGVTFCIILIPINKFIANKIGQLSTKLMLEKDGRVKVITEVLRGIKAIKLYVWEQHFIRRISKLREKELEYLKKRKYLDALCVYFWATTPVLISIFTFGTYVVMGNKLTAATVFTGIALLNMLIGPLNAFPWVLNGLTEAWVSLKRIQKLLDLPKLDLDVFYNNNMLNDKEGNIIIKNGCFNWGKELNSEEKKQLHIQTETKLSKGKGKGKNKMIKPTAEVTQNIFKLENISITIEKGELVGVMGSVGCGKSSLLSAILAELQITEGEIATTQIDEGFGLVTQQPWLQHGTIRDNILFGKTYDEEKYKTVLIACGLAEDLYLLPSGDLTGIGDGGTTLSGGQKARIALARAVYQNKSVYLLDDVLSAVDVNVAKHIFQHCIMKLLKGKTRILCTHLIEYLIYADKIILMENGAIKYQGKSLDVLKSFDSNLPLDLELGDESQTSSIFESSLLSSTLKEQEKENEDDILQQEISETGNVEFHVIKSYLKAVGWPLVMVILASIIFMQTSRNVTDLWLSHWVTSDENDNNSTNITTLYRNNYKTYLTSAPDFATVDFYLKVYIELAIFNTIFTLLRAFLFAYGGVMAATKIHRILLKSVIKGKCVFFDLSPVGRILNRFSSDTYTIDDSLPFIMNILLAQFFGLLGTILITIYGLPWICLILVPMIPIYHWLQYTYRVTSRELKRISSTTLSPVYSHFNESLQGLTSIRAMRVSKRFKRKNEDNVEENIKAQFSSQAAARWLGLRLQFIGVAMVTGVSFIAVLQHHYDVADPGLIGLAVSYALSVTGSLGGVINAFTETEREMIAVERVNQYINQVPSETSHYICDPPFGWPNQGVIRFENVVLKYREHLLSSLKGISFETRPSEKIGIVGRTGAGKSSLITALFRLVEIESGAIFIDAVNVKDVSLSSLRSRIFCIPQEPFLFSGTLRNNLDPLEEFKDADIWSALGKVNLAETIRCLGGLENVVETGGMNFSVGQKQLICLARAVLHNAKVLCIDEATSNVDHETDRLIQFTLRTAFRQSTVLTIAHRVETILDSDRILVVGEGKILEFDTPDNLLADDTSYFYCMVNKE